MSTLKYVYDAGGYADQAYLCCWDDCSKRGTMLHLLRIWEGEELTNYVFCSDRHKQYHINSHVAYGKLPAGHRATY
jgi:hypothetical protein